MSRATEVFFATQGTSYEAARDGGFLWAPQRNKNGGPAMTYWEELTRVEAGNIVIHYARGHFRAISEVHAQLVEGKGWQPYSEAPRPQTLPGYGNAMGWLVKCEYTEFEKPIPLDTFHDVILQYRKSVGGAFSKTARVNQGYLYPLEEGIADAILRKALGNQPELAKLDYLVEYLKGGAE